MIKSTTAMQATIEGLLTTEPITAQEITDKAGATVAMVRLAITTLEHKGKVVSGGHRPVRYCAPAKPTRPWIAVIIKYSQPRAIFGPGATPRPVRRPSRCLGWATPWMSNDQ